MCCAVLCSVRYPLAVKLGTITPNGADVYSYAPEEDSMVKVRCVTNLTKRHGTLREAASFPIPIRIPNLQKVQIWYTVKCERGKQFIRGARLHEGVSWVQQ